MMTNQKASIRFLAAVLLLLIGCTAGRISVQSGDRIIFFGDSITELGVIPSGYVTLVKEELNRRHTDMEIEIIAAGISGNKVTDLVSRLQRDVLWRNPTIVVIYIGINDVWHWALQNLQGTTQEEYEGGLREIIARIQYAGARVVLCTPSVIGEKYDATNPQDAMLEEYAKISRKVARDLGARLCDLREAFAAYLLANNKENKEQGILTYDRVHLNEEGNKLVAREILKSMGED